jgi:polar amino acid transport system ATP-binding protein
MTTAGQDDMIRVSGLHKSFGPLEVLRDISLKVERARTVVVIGPSGSGKSTLLRCINLLEPIDAGTIVFDGQEISAQRGRAHLIRQQISMVFQNFELFQHLTAIENIMLAPVRVKGVPRLEAHDRAVQLLD